MMKKMIVDFEIRIVVDFGMREVQRRKHQPLEEPREQRESARLVFAQVCEIDRTFDCRES